MLKVQTSKNMSSNYKREVCGAVSVKEKVAQRKPFLKTLV